MYKGKDKCAGCGSPGNEKSRSDREALCYDCKETLRIGKTRQQESKVKYSFIFQHYFAFTGKFLNNKIHEFLKAVDIPSAENTDGKPLQNIKYSSGGNGKYYHIDSRLTEPLKSLFLEMEKYSSNIEKQIEELPKLASKQANKERDKIYQEGVERGKSLLVQLNTGEITLQDFDQNQKLYT